AKSDHARIEEVLAEYGREGFLDAWLRAHGLVWAADLIPDLTNLAAPAAAPTHPNPEISP
ncbi:MAG: conjugal transfer ATPase TrbE, partial [Rubritepida sp.]|nr:conjugal transfer ATPase TrbE [Rubritepida sp.]